MLSAGIVGLPNVGKSTLFNAVTRTRKAQAANYPFCTIDPNQGIVTVRGASQGEGLGNQFLSHIRKVTAIVQVVRCFEDADVHHVSGSVDPVRDIEIGTTELVLADLATVQKRADRSGSRSKNSRRRKGSGGWADGGGFISFEHFRENCSRAG